MSGVVDLFFNQVVKEMRSHPITLVLLLILTVAVASMQANKASAEEVVRLETGVRTLLEQNIYDDIRNRETAIDYDVQRYRAEIRDLQLRVEERALDGLPSLLLYEDKIRAIEDKIRDLEKERDDLTKEKNDRLDQLRAEWRAEDKVRAVGTFNINPNG